MLKRKYARISIILFLLAIASAALCIIFSSGKYSVTFAALSILFFIASALVRSALKCPSCNKKLPQPQWSKSGTLRCPKCGKLIEYDK